MLLVTSKKEDGKHTQLQCGVRKVNLKTAAHHLQRSLPQVSLHDQSLLVGDVESTLSQSLDDGIVTQQRLGSIALQNEAAGPAVEVS